MAKTRKEKAAANFFFPSFREKTVHKNKIFMVDDAGIVKRWKTSGIR